MNLYTTGTVLVDYEEINFNIAVNCSVFFILLVLSTFQYNIKNSEFLASLKRSSKVMILDEDDDSNRSL